MCLLLLFNCISYTGNATPKFTWECYHLNPILSTVLCALKRACLAYKQWPFNLSSDFKQKLFKENGSLSEVVDKSCKGG